VLGPEGKVSFSLYDAPKTFDAVRSGEDEIAFLTGGEIASADLGAAVVPGPTVAVTEVGVMVHDPAPIHGIAELGGRRVCVMTGSRAQPAFESAMARLHLSPLRLAFEEDVELLDAYNSGACEAAVGEVTYLADMRRNTGINKEPSRLLPEALASDPIIAVTPQADGPWAASVRWVFDAMLLADAPADAWRASGADALPARTPPGLRPNWRDDVIATVGSYGAVVHRDFTVNLGLPPGPNALWPAGALLPPGLR
jgi:general L-amino acid transport system substrate-binding protein